MKRDISKHVIGAVVGLSLVLLTGTAFSAQVSGKTSTQTAPIQSSTQTAPLPSNTQTVPLPSTTREYQKVEKPLLKPKTLDIPNYDIAGELRTVRLERLGKHWTRIHYQLELMNKGKRNVTGIIPIDVKLINALTKTLFIEDYYFWAGPNIRNDYWTAESRNRYIDFNNEARGAPHTIHDVKLIVDVCPNNAFREANRHRGNNRCIATW